MSIFESAFNLGKTLIHQTEDTIHEVFAPAPLSQPSFIPIANPVKRNRRGRRRVRQSLAPTTEFAPLQSFGNFASDIFNPQAQGFDNFGQQLKEAVFPGTTDTKAGRQTVESVKKGEAFTQSESFRKVAKIAGKILEEFGIASGQPEIAAAGGAMENGLGVSDDVKEARDD